MAKSAALSLQENTIVDYENLFQLKMNHVNYRNTLRLPLVCTNLHHILFKHSQNGTPFD